MEAFVLQCGFDLTLHRQVVLPCDLISNQTPVKGTGNDNKNNTCLE